MMHNILVFGTGSGWQNIKGTLDFDKIKISAFIDNNPKKIGNTLNHRPIIPPHQINNYQFEYILIASEYFKEITEQLNSLNVSGDKILPFYEYASLIKYDFFEVINIKRGCFTDLLRKKIDECKAELAKTFQENNPEKIKKYIERYQRLCVKNKIYSLLQNLIPLVENENQEIQKQILEDLEDHGLSFKYDSPVQTRLSFINKPTPSIISIIIPVFKDVNGLKDTLISLDNQSIPKTDYEVVVVNDGGDPEIIKLCEHFRVKIIEVKPNRGSYYARNRGIEASKGEYLAFVDADIKVPINWLEKGSLLLKKFDYIAGDIKIDESKVNSVTSLYEYLFSFMVTNYLKNFHYGPTANLFVRKKVFETAGGFDERLRSSGDWEFGDRLYRYFNFIQGFSKDITVIHPPRNYAELIKKFKRIRQGHKQVSLLYPNRFKIFAKRIHLLKSIFHAPTGLNNIYGDINTFQKLTNSKVKIFLGFWWLKVVESYYKNF